tara:strand:- start:2987 stop:4489 length:1503 start_codon:yes stop_codon:yes gene_type:complete
MSTGALTQLAAIGSADAYLSIAGEVTFFKGIYRRHTAFAKEAVKMPFTRAPAWGSECTASISRTGDLLSKTWLVVEVPPLNPHLSAADYATWSGDATADAHKNPETGRIDTPGYYPKARFCDELGHAMIDTIEVIIGGTKIDMHRGQYMQIFHELSASKEKKDLDILIGKSGSIAELEEMAKNKQVLYIPLQFWFCRHLQQALPLIALQYHSIEIKVKFKPLESVVAHPGIYLKTLADATWIPVDAATNTSEANGQWSSATTSGQLRPYNILNAPMYNLATDGTYLLCNLVYLEEEERKSFAQSTHEYLIDILQDEPDQSLTTGSSTGSSRLTTQLTLFFNHPVSELIWVLTPEVCIAASEPFCYSALNNSHNIAQDPLYSASLKFNGYDRFDKNNYGPEYFRELVPGQYHTAIPQKHIYCYSFAIEPEDSRPSGTANFSRIDSVKLILDHVPYNEMKLSDAPKEEHRVTGVSGGKVKVYARSKNVLRIRSGMAGLAYAN